MKPEIISWLLEGDPSIRWQVQRDLLNASPAKYELERKKIAKEGWGARLLALQDSNGRWGGGMYGPKVDIHHLHHADLASTWVCRRIIHRRNGPANYFSMKAFTQTGASTSFQYCLEIQRDLCHEHDPRPAGLFPLPR